MKVIALTGGVGMGKSAAASFLETWGIDVIDTDMLARIVVEPGQPASAEVRRVFGDECFTADGQLRRDELARRVFSDPEARKQLEAILHPRIRERWLAQVAAWRRRQRPVAVVVIPLLFETQSQEEFDVTVCVACSLESQRSRLRDRGWTDEQIEQRIRSQWAVPRKMALADHVIWTEGSLETHAEQLRRIMRVCGFLIQ
jgi:dephospho-CoA kinase